MATNALQGQKDLDECAKLLRWNYIVTMIVGLWPMRPSNFRFYLNFGYIFIFILLEFLDLILFIDSLEHVLMNLTENLAFTPIIVRMYILRIYKDKLKELISEIQKDFDAKEYTDEEKNAFLYYNIKSKTYMKLLIVNTILTATSYYLKPLLGQISEITEYVKTNNASFIFILPYRFYTFYEVKDASTYLWTYGCELPFVFVSGFGQCAGDCLIITTVYHVSGQMAVLALRITNISTDPSVCTNEIQKIVKLHIRLLR